MPSKTPVPRVHTTSLSGTLSVLVVDDHRDAADSLADLLRLCGHGVQTVYDPAAALAADPPDVVILELRLRGTDGWELVRRMRDRVAGKPPVYVAVTTCGREQDRRKSYLAGIDAHLVKPLDVDLLLGVLARVARGAPAAGG